MVTGSITVRSRADAVSSRVAVATGGGPARGVRQVEQVRPLRLVKLQRPSDGVQHTGGHPGKGASLELGAVLDAPPGQRGDLVAAQSRDPAIGAAGRPAWSGGDLGAPRDKELADFLAIVHATNVRAARHWWDALPVHPSTGTPWSAAGV